jgi:hypothetical protein
MAPHNLVGEARGVQCLAIMGGTDHAQQPRQAVSDRLFGSVSLLVG